MGFYYEQSPFVAAPHGAVHVARGTTKIRVASGGLGSIQTLIAKRYPGYKPPVVNTTVPTRLTPTPVAPSPAPQPAPPRVFSPVQPIPTATQPAPTPTQPTTTTFSPVTSGPTPTPVDSGAGFTPVETSPGGSGGSTSGGPGGPPSPSYATPLTVRFDTTPSQPDTSTMLPDVSSGPEIYNADGTPATPAAQAQSSTLAAKLRALPTAAKIGGAVLAYLLLHG